MDYYLRKKTTLGPMRFRVEPEAAVLTSEVVDSHGNHTPATEEYSLKGRKGLYYRTHHKGGRLSARQAQERSRGLLFGVFFVSLSMITAFSVLLAGPIVAMVNFFIVMSLGAALMVIDANHCHRMIQAKLELDQALVDPEQIPAEAERERLYSLSREMSFPVELREDIYLAVLDRVVDDRKLTSEEAELLETAKYILALPKDRVEDMHREMVSSIWIQAMEEPGSRVEEMEWITRLSRDLGIPEQDVDAEKTVFQDLQELRDHHNPIPQGINTDAYRKLLDTNEDLQAAVEVELLSPRIHLEGNRWRVDKSGPLLITHKRLLLLGESETVEIPLESISEVELDVDENHLIIHRSGLHYPLRIRTEHPCRLGHLLSRVRDAA